MRLIGWLQSVYSNVFHGSAVDREMEEELLSHIEHRADDLERSGLSRAVAERRARVEFGGYGKYKEQGHEALMGQGFESFGQDVRMSLRKLRNSPGFLIAAVLTLALAIGANAVVFGMLNALFLRPLNVPDPDSLYAIERGPDKMANNSYPDYLDLRDRNRTFDSVALYNIVSAGLDTGNNATEFWGYEVSGNYFDTLRIQPYLGRFFHDADEHGPNSAPYLVISHAYWHSRFQDDRSVVGRVVQVNKRPFTILGVAPPAFHGTLLFFFPDFWLPAVNHELLAGRDVIHDRGRRPFIMTFGRLKPGVTPQQAIADFDQVGAWLMKTYPKVDANMTFALARPSLAGDLLGSPARGFVTALMLLAGLILLAACANLGGLFAARAADRSREVALRLALGSSRRRIVRQVFTEAVLISLAGGALGLAGSVTLLRVLSTWHPVPTFPIVVPMEADAKVYWVALLLAVVSGFLFGAVPVRQILRTNPYEVVKAGTSGIVAGNTGRKITVRDVLLVVQISICAVLVTSSLVAVRGLIQSMHSNFGFDPAHAMILETNLTESGLSGERATGVQRRMLEAVQAIPGVTAAGLVDQVPLGGGGAGMDAFRDETTDLRTTNAAADSMVYRVSPDYFSAAGTLLLTGRTFNWHDDKDSIRVGIINREFAVKVFGSVEKAIGRYYKLADGTRVQVTGIAEDGKYYQLTEDQQPAMFLPMLQAPFTATSMIVRSNRDPESLASAMRLAARNVDAGMPVGIVTWQDELGIALFASRVATVSLGVLGGMGAMLAITGVFGMAAFSVSKRLRELGIRMALGAQGREVLQAALGRPLKLLALGSASGLALGMLATKVLAYIVYQANPRDPLVLLGVVFAMLLLGLTATWIPAVRALSVDPMILLREE